MLLRAVLTWIYSGVEALKEVKRRFVPGKVESGSKHAKIPWRYIDA
jgi:hypothetical protein